jgi:outer membrane protein OmpA-like peptidoglycan-associated protein
MKTLIVLLLAALGLGAAYWKLEHPDATVDDLKAGALSTVDRAKTGFEAFRNKSSDAASMSAMGTSTIGASTIGTSATGTSGAEPTVPALDSTVVYGRLTDAERRMDATDQKIERLTNSIDTLVSDTDEKITQLSDSVTTAAAETEQQFNQLTATTEMLAADIETVASSLGNLNDNVATSAGTATSTASDISELQTRLDSLASTISDQDAEQTLTNIGTRIDAMDAQLTELANSQQEPLAELSATLAQLSDANQALESRLNTLSVDANDADDPDGNLRAQVDQRLSQMESKLATANADSVRLNDLASRVEATNAQLTALNRELSTVQNATPAPSPEIEELRTLLNANQAETTRLQQQLQAANERLAAVSDELSELKATGTGSSVESLQAELNAQLDALKAQIESANVSTDNTDVASLNLALSTTRDRIQQLESRIQGLPTDDDTAEAAQQMQSELQQQIAAMEARLSELPQQTDPDLLNTLSQVQQEVAELRDREVSTGIEYKVYFDRGGTGISDEAAVVLKSFIKQEQNRTTGVNIYGFTDRRGDAEYNQRLALQRATAVRSFLIQNGFDFTKIKSLSGLGEDAAAATLDDGTEDADQRAVVLVADQP